MKWDTLQLAFYSTYILKGLLCITIIHCKKTHLSIILLYPLYSIRAVVGILRMYVLYTTSVGLKSAYKWYGT